jgi:hypothetical protein
LVLFLLAVPLVGTASLASSGVVFACTPDIHTVASAMVTTAEVAATLIGHALAAWHEILTNLM